MCTVILFGIILYFTTISRKNIPNITTNTNDVENPRKFRHHYSNAMDSRSIMCSFGNGRLGNQVPLYINSVYTIQIFLLI